MASQKQPQLVTYRLTRFQIIKNPETGEREKVYPAMECAPSMYIHIDEKGMQTQKVYSLTTMPDQKTGKLVPKVEDIWFRNGFLQLVLPKQQALMEFMDNSPNLLTPENERLGNKIYFEKVNAVKEKQSDISKTDAIVEAFNLIATAELIDLMEYAKALGIDTTDFDEEIAKGGKKNFAELRKKDFVQMIIVDLKGVAQGDPAKFIKGLSDPLRGALAAINEGTKLGVITFDSTANQYCWKIGNDRTPIQNIPKGVEHEKWFAQWLTENKTTMTELQSRVEMSKKAVEQ